MCGADSDHLVSQNNEIAIQSSQHANSSHENNSIYSTIFNFLI